MLLHNHLGFIEKSVIRGRTFIGGGRFNKLFHFNKNQTIFRLQT